MQNEKKGTVPFDPKSEYDYQALRIAKAFKDEKHVPSYREIFEYYDDRWIIAVFERVRDLPDEKIKKSRAALFFYMIKKYGKRKDANTGN